VKSEPHKTRHGDWGPWAVLAPPKLLGVWRIVTPLQGAENLGKSEPLNLKPHNSVTPWANPPKFNIYCILKQTTNAENFARNCTMDMPPEGHLYSKIWKKNSVKFQFLRFHNPTPALMGWNMERRSGPYSTHTCQISPYWCKASPCGAKSLKIALWVS